MIKDRCFYFAKTQNECDLASFRLDEKAVKKSVASFASDRHVGRPDLLSNELTGDWELWWAVLRMNGVEDPFNDIERGLAVETPSIEFLPDYFNSAKHQS